jgi:hypothetical protein
MPTLRRVIIMALLVLTLIACQSPRGDGTPTAVPVQSGTVPIAPAPLATGRTTTLGELSATATAVARSTPQGSPTPTRTP